MPKYGSRLGVPVVVIVAVLGVAGGCGDDRLPVAPAEGKVLYQGKPLAFGSVMFQPAAGPPGAGAIGPGGTFRLSTYGDGDGAVIGTHRVRITCLETQRPGAPPPSLDEEPGAGESLIPRKYAAINTSGLTAEVKSANEPFVFELGDE